MASQYACSFLGSAATVVAWAVAAVFDDSFVVVADGGAVMVEGGAVVVVEGGAVVVVVDDVDGVVDARAGVAAIAKKSAPATTNIAAAGFFGLVNVRLCVAAISGTLRLPERSFPCGRVGDRRGHFGRRYKARGENASVQVNGVIAMTRPGTMARTSLSR